jgi:hypothetical protein
VPDRVRVRPRKLERGGEGAARLGNALELAVRSGRPISRYVKRARNPQKIPNDVAR